MNEETKDLANKITMALEKVQGTATYNKQPSKETVEAVNRMAEKAYNSDFLASIKKMPLKCMEAKCFNAPTQDYNGHGHYVCDYHYNKLNKEFDEEYR